MIWRFIQDIHNAFLNGGFDENIYMRPPPGFASPQPHFVCKLRKSLHSLWQAPQQWHSKLASVLQDNGFKKSLLDHSLFIYNHNGVFLVLLIYVDDLVLTGNNPTHCEAFKVYLNKHFKWKDLGSLKYFLSIEVARSSKGLFLCQGKYTLDILTEAGLLAPNRSFFLWSRSYA